MKQQGAGRGGEDDWWWRELYGDGPGEERAGAERSGGARPDGASDTFDDRIESALRTVRRPGEGAGAGASGASGAPAAAPDPRVAPPAGAAPGPDGRTPAERPPASAAAGASATSSTTASESGAESEAAVAPEASGSGELELAEAFEPRPWEPSGWEPRPWELPAPSVPSPLEASEPLLFPNTGRTAGPSAGPAADGPTTTEMSPDPDDACGFPEADPEALDELVPDTVLDGAAFGSLAVRGVSQRGAGARRRGEARRDAFLTARFGAGRDALLLIAVATGSSAAARTAPRAAQDACAWLGRAVGRSATQLARDLRGGRSDALRTGLQRLTDRGYGTLRGRGAEADAADGTHPAALRCLLLSADPDCRTRVCFGVGAGGFFRLREGGWEDLEPDDAEPFRFRTEPGRPGDVLLLCGTALAEHLGADPEAAARLAAAWSAPRPPGLIDFLAAVQPEEQRGSAEEGGDAGDRTAVGVWEA
ncbi:protein phosphatase 2C domain-containing protein [Streptomyces sp. NPDC057555]|uniref:protein phosphatase 2C domain-containing protein n=1 Tax=Streptomyces sp. NPDC057555 TaxID=3346166 RepID=UPI0036925C3A